MASTEPTIDKAKLDKKLKTWEKDFNKHLSKLSSLPWIVQGSVVEIAPPPGAPRAKPRYIWTRKVNQKTVTVSLSKAQYKAFMKAIESNRKVEDTLKDLRNVSQTVLLESLPGVQKRRRSTGDAKKPAAKKTATKKKTEAKKAAKKATPKKAAPKKAVSKKKPAAKKVASPKKAVKKAAKKVVAKVAKKATKKVAKKAAKKKSAKKSGRR